MTLIFIKNPQTTPGNLECFGLDSAPAASRGNLRFSWNSGQFQAGFFRDEKQDLVLSSLGMPLELCREESRG